MVVKIVKKAVSFVIDVIGFFLTVILWGLIFMVIIGIIVGLGALFMWVSGPSSPPSGPTIKVTTIDNEVDSGTSPYDDKEISCMVESVSRVDVKWDDLICGLFVDGSEVGPTDVEYVSIDEYVSEGDTIIVTYIGFEDTSRVKVKMLHVPTASTGGCTPACGSARRKMLHALTVSTALEWSVTCT